MSAIPRLQNPTDDTTELYVCVGDSCPPSDNVIWRTWADVRGGFPGFQISTEPLLEGRVQLSPNFFMVDNDRLSFAIPTSAIERFVLCSPIDRPNGAVMQVDYCDSQRKVRRFWLRMAKRRLPSVASTRLNRLAASFAEAGVANIGLSDIVLGFRPPQAVRHGSVWDSRHAEWEGDAIVSIASGDCRGKISIGSDWLLIRVDSEAVVLGLRHILGYLHRSGASDSERSAVFLAWMEDETRIDLRLVFPQHQPDAGATAAEGFVAELAHREVPALGRSDADREATSHTGALSSDFGDGVLNAPASETRGLITRVGRLGQPAGRSPGAGIAGEPELKLIHGAGSALEKAAGDAPSDDIEHKAVYGNAAARLQTLKSLHDTGLISGEEVQQQRSRIFRDLDAAYRLAQLKALHDAALITDVEYEAKRADLVKAL